MNLTDIKDNSSARKYMNVYLKYNLDVKIFMNIDQYGPHNDIQLVTIWPIYKLFKFRNQPEQCRFY